MADKDSGRLRFMMFTSFAPAGPPGMAWHHPKAVNFDYLNVADWVRLVQALEAATFDGIFWADHSGVHDTYQGSWAMSVKEAVQFPLGDPLLLTAALASATRNLGFDAVGAHASRYERAEEYVTVIYKLLEGSWDADAVVRDVGHRVYADPEKVREITHEGKYFKIQGIHTSEPSPQRVPLLFQAGSSADGRNFASQNAEAIFIAAHNPRGARAVVDDLSSRLTAKGRRPSDVQYFAHRNYVIGSTEAEARRKDARTQELLSSETTLAFSSSTMGVDLATIELDVPVGDFQTNALQGQFKALAEAAPDKRWTFRDVVTYVTRNRFVGTPEQAADELEDWRAAGINGMNVTLMTGTEDMYDFLEHVTPVFKQRGLMQKEYAPGTLREKFFAGTRSESGPRINARHPAARYRATA